MAMTRTLENDPVTLSAPCRLDFGGTLDISTFFFPLRNRMPVTFNIALDMRTRVRLMPWTPGKIKISSRGFDSVEFDRGASPYSHPLGLMLCVCDYFDAQGLHVSIESSSPPRSALGGSSVAAVALIAALMILKEDVDPSMLPLSRIVLLAYHIESCVLRVPCGMQDQLAAAYGGVNAWRFTGDVVDLPYERRIVLPAPAYAGLESSILAAYCGDPHESVNINGKWVDHFMTAKDRRIWHDIMDLTHGFSDAVAREDYETAARLMNRETDLRMSMTPDVLDDTGKQLAQCARDAGCGIRFTGAGGGGCVWAMGRPEGIDRLKPLWQKVLSTHEHAGFLDTTVAHEGLRLDTESPGPTRTNTD